ncbi:(2Fe-2S)-binding protein [bacterium]|nr:(2Fe-2S)-binding protein [bacterium]
MGTPSPKQDRAEVMTLSINGAQKTVALAPHALLLDTLRSLGLTGTKRGCDMGTCGCCAVQVDGLPVLSCLLLTKEAAGKEISTIEGLGTPNNLAPLQRLFWEVGGSQCGFCTPGFLITADAFLRSNPDPTDQEIREAISGNLCRCTGYTKIIKAIRLSAKERAKE